jgi:signal transduction histidine kinase
MLDIALGNCDRLVRLVNDIVDFEHIGSGELKLEKKSWDVLDLLRRSMDLDRSSANRAGLHFRIDAEPAEVFVDGERIQQTLGNLVRNAIKFSQKGGEIRLRASITGETEVTFEVQDQGRGIPPDQLEIIFDRFQQGDSSDSRAIGGTGLGLAICRSIVEQHGGRIWATSSPGEGSTFHFTVERFIEPDELHPDTGNGVH